MLKIIGIILIVLLAICIVCLVYSCCVISGRTSRQEEELERIYKANGLSDLENVTLEQLLKMYEEDKISFIINDGKVVDYETEK